MPPGGDHDAALTNTHAGFGSATTGWSEERPLRTPPEPSPTSSVRIAVFGDMGAAGTSVTGACAPGLCVVNGAPADPDGAASAHSEAMSARTVGVLASHLDDIDLVLHIGDLAYARGNQQTCSVSDGCR